MVLVTQEANYLSNVRIQVKDFSNKSCFFSCRLDQDLGSGDASEMLACCILMSFILKIYAFCEARWLELACPRRIFTKSCHFWANTGSPINPILSSSL